jgi:hypothetical protein
MLLEHTYGLTSNLSNIVNPNSTGGVAKIGSQTGTVQLQSLGTLFSLKHALRSLW